VPVGAAPAPVDGVLVGGVVPDPAAGVPVAGGATPPAVGVPLVGDPPVPLGGAAPAESEALVEVVVPAGLLFIFDPHNKMEFLESRLPQEQRILG
jgi:hypothetical protein